MTTSPTVPQWLTELVPADTLEKALSVPFTSEALTDHLAPLVTQYRMLVELCDDVVLLRLAKAGHPVLRNGNKAITTSEAYDIVDETLDVLRTLFPAFEVLRALRDQLEMAEWAGLQWTYDEEES